MDIVLKDMDDEKLDLLAMAIDSVLGHASIDFSDPSNKDCLEQLKIIRQEIINFRSSLLTEEDVRQMSRWAEAFEFDSKVESSNAVTIDKLQ